MKELQCLFDTPEKSISVPPEGCQGCPLLAENKRYVVHKRHPVDILFVMDSPNIHTIIEQRFVTNEDRDAANVEFLMNSTLDEYKQNLRKIYDNIHFDVTHEYAFTVSCLINSLTDSAYKTAKGKPNMRMIRRCGNYMLHTIRRLDPKIIIPVGDNAAKALYLIFKKYNNIVAKTNYVKVLDKYYPAIPLLKADVVAENDNKYTISKMCITNALDYIFYKKGTIKQEIDISNYLIPQTVEEVRDICRNTIIPAVSGENRDFLAVDIETNSKYPYHKDSKMIMISFSWREGHACSIWFDSKHSPFNFKNVTPYIQEVLNSDSRKVFHNATFDYKFLAYTHGFVVKNVCWDTMLTEHILDENMKGFYNLEYLAGHYVPRFENYKKLALKKISVKDDLNRPEEDTSEDENENDIILTTTSVDTEGYAEIIKKYEEDVIEYENKVSQYKIDAAKYPELLAEWNDKYKKYFDIKLNTISDSEEKETIKKLRIKAKQLKPVKPSRKGIVKPVKPDIDKFSGDDTKSNFEDYDPYDLAIYCSMDSDITRRIAIKQKNRILEEDPSLFTIIGHQHMPALKALSSMEFIGANTDQAYLDQIEKELKVDYELLEDELKQLTGREDFKPKSGAHIATAIHSTYGIPVDPEMVTGSNQPKTDRESLLKHARNIIKQTGTEVDPAILKDDNKFKDFLIHVEGKHIVAFIGKLLKFKDVDKAYKTTLANFRKYTAYDGRLRTSYHQNGTATGRLSSSGPNLQNIAKTGGGKNLKKFIIPDREDHILVNIDIKAAEIRCLLAYAHEKSLIQSILDGLDFHCTTASEVWLDRFPQYASSNEFYASLFEAHNATEPTTVQKELCRYRQMTKAVNFGLMYGITKFGLSRDLNCTKDEAQEIINNYFKRYSKIKKYMDDTEKQLRKNGEVQSLTRRKRRFPRYLLNPFKAYRQAINFKIQNIASDLVVRELIGQCHRTIKSAVGGRIVLTVHDSALISMPKNNLQKLPAYLDDLLIKSVKEKYPWLPVPFEYDIEWGYNYGELQKLTEND